MLFRTAAWPPSQPLLAARGVETAAALLLPCSLINQVRTSPLGLESETPTVNDHGRNKSIPLSHDEYAGQGESTSQLERTALARRAHYEAQAAAAAADTAAAESAAATEAANAAAASRR